MLNLKTRNRMSNTTIAMHVIKKIYTLYDKGLSKVKISDRLQLSRNTVKKYIRFLKENNITNQQLQELTDQELSIWFRGSVQKKSKEVQTLEKYFPGYEKRLKQTGVTREQLWKEYKSDHPDGLMYSRFCHYYRQWKKQSNPVMRFEHKAGDKMFVDFTGKKLHIEKISTGELVEGEVFISVLGSSQLTYVEAVASQKKEDFVSCCENALHYYGGVPACITTDNLEAAVIKSNKYEPSLNETFADFARHYDTTILPCRVYKPKDKALVENMVRIIYTRVYTVLNKQTFYTLEQLNKVIWEQLEIHNNTPFQKRPFSRRELFEEVEKQYLEPLPSHKYELKRYAYATVYKNCYVYLHKDKHYYSTPHQYIGQRVKLIYSNSCVEIYRKYLRVALHKCNREVYKHSTIDGCVCSNPNLKRDIHIA